VAREDKELAEACLAGDQRACTALVETYVPWSVHETGAEHVACSV